MANAIKRNGLTAKQTKYVVAYAELGNAEKAAAAAGYAFPVQAAAKLEAHPVVDAAARRAHQVKLWELVPAAIESLRTALTPGATIARGASIEVELANEKDARREVLKNTIGLGDAEGGDKALHEMTADELEAQLRRLEARQAELAGMAVDVTPDPEESGVFG